MEKQAKGPAQPIGDAQEAPRQVNDGLQGPDGDAQDWRQDSSGRNHQSKAPSVVSEICSALRERGEELTEAIEKMRIEGSCCISVLQRLEKEELDWKQKLDIARRKLSEAEKQKMEAEILLELHRSLGSAKCLDERVKTIQRTILAQVPEDVKVMVDDCLNPKSGLHTGECVVCLSEFTAADLLSVRTSDKCRHALYPCGHAAVCGTCANRLWMTTKTCPLCRATMNKKPTIFKPGRWQM